MSRHHTLTSRRHAASMLAALAISMLLCTGCAVGPDYQRPLNPLPAQYASEESDSEATAAPATADTANTQPPLIRHWWKLYEDPLLDDLVDRALRNNPDILIATARIEEANAQLGIASAALIPEVSLGATANRNEVSSRTATPPPAAYPLIRQDFTGNLSTAFELDFWGKLHRANEAARAQALASTYGKSVVELTLLGSLTQTYFNLRSLDAQLAVALDTQASRSAARDIANSRFSAGQTSEIELHRAQAEHAAVSAQIADLRQQRAILEHQLAVLTGTPELKLTPGDLRQLPLPPLPPAGLPGALLDARPDLRLAEQQLIAANARIGVAKAALFPSISLTANLGRESKDLATLFSAGSGIWGLGLGMNLPFIDAGKRSALLDQASAQQKQALASYQQAIQIAFKEVRDALASNAQRADAEQALTEQMEANTKNLKLSQLRYDAGYSAYLEVLDSQRSANDATQAYIRNRQSRLTASVDLFKALGGGWDHAH